MVEWVRDRGLSMRMLMTMFLLVLVYLIFLTVLYTIGVGYMGLLLFAGGFILLQYYFSDKLVLYTSGAKVVDENEAPELYSMVRELSMNAGLPMPRVAIVDTPVPNAFATGRNPQNAVVAVTTGLLRTLNYEELKAVIGHELSHVKNRDVAVITIASFLSTVAWFVMRWAMFAGMFGDRRDNTSTNIIILAVSALVWFISFLLIRALSRYREYAADLGSAYLTRNPEALISALMKISGKMERISPQYKKEAEGLNAFYIIPALSGESLLSLFSTHPPVEKRVERLQKISAELGIY